MDVDSPDITTVPATGSERATSAEVRREGRVAGRPGLERIAVLAAKVFGTACAAILLIGDGQVRVAAQIGLTESAPDQDALFAKALPPGDVLVVPDAIHHPVLSACPLVAGPARMRFCAASALHARDGRRVGFLLIADPEPRAAFPAGARAALAQLAAAAADHLDDRDLPSSQDGPQDNARGFLTAMQSAVLTTDRTGTITFANPACETLLGYEPGDMLGRNVSVIVPARFHAQHTAGLAARAAGGTPRLAGKTVEVTAVRRDGTEVPIELSLSSWGSGATMGIGAEIRDISERRRRDARLLRLAHHDASSGLPNRVRLVEVLGEAFSDGGRAGLLALAVEGLRSVGDTLGNGLCDALLEALVIRLRAQLPGDALLARIADDELAVLLPGQGDPLAVQACAKTLVAALSEPVHVGDHLLHAGASIGVAFGPADGADAEELLASADLALHQARRDRARNVRLFETTMRSAAANRRALQDTLRQALERGELELHYQPQVDLTDGRTCGAEALIRWRHPERGLMAPGEFLPAIESSTLALSVGWWTIEEACRQAAAWRRDGVGPLRIAVNLFAAQVRSGTLDTIVTEALQRHGLPPDALELELTEIIALERDETTLAPIRSLLARGVSIAFDDFGTGFASLSTLKNFPLTKLKIDRSFVRDILTDAHDAAIARAVLDLGRSLGLTVVAEGIESGEQERALVAMGCRYGQGFRYGRALQAHSFAQRLAAERNTGTARPQQRLAS